MTHLLPSLGKELYSLLQLLLPEALLGHIEWLLYTESHRFWLNTFTVRDIRADGSLGACFLEHPCSNHLLKLLLVVVEVWQLLSGGHVELSLLLLVDKGVGCQVFRHRFSATNETLNAKQALLILVWVIRTGAALL